MAAEASERGVFLNLMKKEASETGEVKMTWPAEQKRTNVKEQQDNKEK